MSDALTAMSFDEKAQEILRARAASLAAEAEEEGSDDRIGILLFALGEETYGVMIEDVREIFLEYDVTPVPCVPEHVEGVINIRGEIVSVTLLSTLMNLPAGELGRPQAIVVENGECATAIVVDEIGDIVEVPRDSIEPPVSMIGKAQADFVSGSVYVDGRLVGIVNLGRVLRPVGGPDNG